jgi:hypothetical protein
MMTFSILTKRYLDIGLKAIVGFFLILAIAGCGAGGKDANSATNTPSLTLSLIDSAGNSVINMVIGRSYSLKATVTQSSGLAANAIVTFSPGSLATLSPASGTALTSAIGLATLGIVPTTAGADTASASASVTLLAPSADSKSTITSTVTVTGSFNYSVTAAAPSIITLSAISLAGSALASAEKTAVDLNVYANGALASASSIPVGFTATCGQVNPSIVSTDGNGHVTTTYNSVKTDGTLCQGTATITATARNVTEQVNLTVATPTTGSVIFVSAFPSQIFLNNSGASAQSVLTFKVLGASGSALPNWPIDFTLTGNPGNVSFATQNNTARVTLASDASGLVSIPVFAGGTPGPITLRAAWNTNAAIFTTSNNFTVASGPPQQARMSLAVSTHNIEGWSVDGTPTTITTTLSDANGNPVPDGTVVNFVTDGGTINRSCSTSTANDGGLNAAGFSRCSVTLMSANPRPTAGTSPAGVTSVYPTNGRVHVLAYLEGTKTYRDVNNNNQFDAGVDIVSDQGDAYRDDNENNRYDAGEFVIAKSGTLTCVNPAVGGNALLAVNTIGAAGSPAPSRDNTCSGANTIATTVRAQVAIAFSSSDPFVRNFVVSGSGGSFTLNGLMKNADGTFSSLLPMPSGTGVTATSSAPTCTVTVTPNAVANLPITGLPTANYGSYHVFTTSGTSCASSTFKLTTIAPSGKSVTISAGTL